MHDLSILIEFQFLFKFHTLIRLLLIFVTFVKEETIVKEKKQSSYHNKEINFTE